MAREWCPLQPNLPPKLGAMPPLPSHRTQVVNRRWLGPGWQADHKRDPTMRLKSAETRTTDELERVSLPRIKDEWDGERRRAAARRASTHADCQRARRLSNTSLEAEAMDEELSAAHAAQLRLLERMGATRRAHAQPRVRGTKMR